MQENVVEVEMCVESRHHRHFVSRKADVLRQISDECGGVSIVFPRQGSNSDKVVIKGARECVDTATARIRDTVTQLVRTSLSLSSLSAVSVSLAVCVSIIHFCVFSIGFVCIVLDWDFSMSCFIFCVLFCHYWSGDRLENDVFCV